VAVDHEDLQTFQLGVVEPSRLQGEVEAIVEIVAGVDCGKDTVAAPVEFGSVGVLEEGPGCAFAPFFDGRHLQGVGDV